MNDESIDAGLAFIQEAERLKDILRVAYTTGGRQESTPEHSWRLCLMAMVFRPQLGDIDFIRLLELCVIHDLGEAIHGDTPATADHDPAEKSARERADLQTLMTPLGEERRRHFLQLWDEYETGSSTEAQLVKETLIYSFALWRSGCVRIKARSRRRTGATSRGRNAEAGAS